MKYFNPSYWFKLWVLSAPLFNDKTQGINAKSIDNKNIKDWVSNNNTSLEAINEVSYTNSTTNYQPYILNETNQNINPIYQTYLDSFSNQQLETSTHKHRHEKSRNRDKRGVNGGNEIEYGTSGLGGNFYASFKPEFWEEIVELKLNNNKENFAKKFTDKCFNGVWMDYKIENRNAINDLGIGIYNNFWTIANKFIDSSRKERIRIVIYYNSNSSPYGVSFNGSTIKFVSVNIRTDDSNWYPNKYLNSLKNDFPDWNHEKNITLGLINDDNNFYIKNAIKNKYSNFDTSKIEVTDKTFSYFNQINPQQFGGYKAKIYVNSANKYSFGNLRPTFTYVTQTKIDEINNIIDNDPKVKQWINHINEFNSNLPYAINNAKTFSYQQLYNWKRQEKEIIKAYIRDWTYVHKLIEDNLKLDELNKNVQGLKTTFQSIANQINNLDRRVQNLENQSNLNCANIATVTAGVTSVIPAIGSIAGAVATVTSGVCAIAGV